MLANIRVVFFWNKYLNWSWNSYFPPGSSKENEIGPGDEVEGRVVFETTYRNLTSEALAVCNRFRQLLVQRLRKKKGECSRQYCTPTEEDQWEWLPVFTKDENEWSYNATEPGRHGRHTHPHTPDDVRKIPPTINRPKQNRVIPRQITKISEKLSVTFLNLRQMGFGQNDFLQYLTLGWLYKHLCCLVSFWHNLS